MGLLDKIKDLFMEEEPEEEEFELEEDNSIYEEPRDILPTVMRETIKKEEEEGLKFEDLKPLKKDSVKKEILQREEKEPVVEKTSKKFSFPIEFEEEVAPSRVANRNILNVEKTKEKEVPKKVVELYPKKEEVKEKPKFKPTPVISPVYGVLDKNYRKDEVREKAEENFEMKRPSKKVDFESVRKKAFGNLSDDIRDNLLCEKCELYKEAKRLSNTITSDDLLYDMMVDEEKLEEPITIEKAYDNYEDFGVAYEPKKEETKIENNTTIINNNTEINIAEKIEIEEQVEKNEEIKEVEEKVDTISFEEDEKEVDLKLPSRQEKKHENKVDEDFFELIDSMYKERTDG